MVIPIPNPIPRPAPGKQPSNPTTVDIELTHRTVAQNCKLAADAVDHAVRCAIAMGASSVRLTIDSDDD